jgi:hypothetical protein
MGGHQAERLRIECPICHEELDGDPSDHLREGHTKESLVRYILADMAADENENFV